MNTHIRLKEDKKYKERIKKRAEIIKLIRSFFDKQDFLEVQTPLCVRLPGMEPYLNPFKTFVKDIYNNSYDAYLITSPEYAMKKLLVGGFEKIYQLSSCFRNNEEFGGTHNPEFIMIEWYRTLTDYRAMIDDTINLMKYICKELNGVEEFEYNGVKFNLNDIEEITVVNAWKKYIGNDLCELLELQQMKEFFVEYKGVSIESIAFDTWDDLFFKVFINDIEQYLGKTKITVLKDYPLCLASLSQKKKEDTRFCERFEIYCGGLELCNGFTELTDANEQKIRLKEEYELRKKLNKDIYAIDETFLEALKLGMPNASGNALGVDRLIMLFTDAQKIEDVILFSASELFE